MWGAMKRLLGRSSVPQKYEPRPPEVAVDSSGAEVRFDSVPQWRIEWQQLREVAIEVTVVPDVGYAEAFWQLSGDGVDLYAPGESRRR